MPSAIREYMAKHGIAGEFLEFPESCHTAEEAAAAAKADINHIVKNVCLIDGNGNAIIAIVRATDRASTGRLGKLLGTEIRVATAAEVLAKTGYPPGGVPSFGTNVRVFIDDRVMEQKEVYTSGGTANSLVKIMPDELKRVSKGEFMRIRK